MLENVEWGQFKLGDLFDVQTPKKRFDSNKVTVQEYGGHPYVVRTGLSNGVKGFIVEDEVYLNEANTLSFGQDTATVFYQEKPYFTGDKIKILNPKFAKFNNKIAYFFVAAIKKSFSAFSWGSSSFNINIIKNQMINVPVKCSGHIDLELIENFIAQLEAERIAQLEAERIAQLKNYLQVSDLDNYTLNDREKEALKKLEDNDIEWKEFKVGEIFDIGTGSLIPKTKLANGSIPRISAKSDNNGVINNFDTETLEDARHFENFISVNFFGSDGGIFYHPYKSSVEMKVHSLKPVNFELNSENAFFIIGSLMKVLSGFDYGNQLSSSKLKNMDFYIQLPVLNNEIDFHFIENAISASKKIAIKDVASYADREISLTKMAVQQ